MKKTIINLLVLICFVTAFGQVNNKKSTIKMDKITIGGGCFWCTESVFRTIGGIESVESGYAGGKQENPTYEQVCSGVTGHAEVVQLTYDVNKINLEEILLIFMATHNPTTLNRQGNDIGTQYRSVIFYENQKQKKIAEQVINELQPEYDNKIVTEITLLTDYFKAEDYHQNYYTKNPEQAYCNAVIPPKIKKIKRLFSDKLK